MTLGAALLSGHARVARRASCGFRDRLRSFRALRALPIALVALVFSWTIAIVFRPRFAAISTRPSKYISAGEYTMKTKLRPFLKIDVNAAPGASIGIRNFSLTSATNSVIGDEYGPRIASTRSWTMSFS